MASCVETNFRNHFTATGARLGEMTLQRANAYSQLTCGMLEGCATVLQRCSNGRSNRVLGGQRIGRAS